MKKKRSRTVTSFHFCGIRGHTALARREHCHSSASHYANRLRLACSASSSVAGLRDGVCIPVDMPPLPRPMGVPAPSGAAGASALAECCTTGGGGNDMNGSTGAADEPSVALGGTEADTPKLPAPAACGGAELASRSKGSVTTAAADPTPGAGNAL